MMYNYKLNNTTTEKGCDRMQNEIKTESQVFSANGQIQNIGWSRQPLFNFDKSLCSKRLSLCERDSYMISNNEVSIYLSIEKKGLTSCVTAIVADHQNATMDSCIRRKYMTVSSPDMPCSSKNGDVTFTDTRVGMNFSNTALRRYIRCEFVNFCKDKNLYINISLEDASRESLNALLPFKENRKDFYLKRFMPGMRASGIVRCGGAEYNLSPENTLAFLDWQRYCTHEKTYYHALYANTTLEDSRQFALCLAGGLGNTSAGSENCYILDGKVYKFSSIKAEGNEERPDKPWRFTAGSSAMDIQFRPEIKSGRLMYKKCGNKTVIFGKIYGFIKQMDTEKILIDALPAHLEFLLT